jgi:hypothetical protein
LRAHEVRRPHTSATSGGRLGAAMRPASSGQTRLSGPQHLPDVSWFVNALKNVQSARLVVTFCRFWLWMTVQG